jgi:alanyl-tRNA synthetase
MTQRLYYNDSYMAAFSARIVERTTHDAHPTVALDRTAFYPEGGGQPADRGDIGGVNVVDVQTRDADGAVLHVLAGDPPEGDAVDCHIDWPRRFDFMQQHTGQHVLTEAFVRAADAHTIGFHLSEDTVTIDLDRADLPPAVVTEAEALANRVIFEDRPVVTRLIDPADTEGVRMRAWPDELHTDGLRIVEVADFDTTACGGTHVARSGAIGLIKVLKVENHRDGSRVTFCCGGRALRDYAEKHAILSNLATELTVGYWEVGEAVDRLRDDLKGAGRALRSARGQLVELEADRLLASAPAHDGERIVSAAFTGLDGGEIRALAARLVESDGVVALLGAAGEKAQVICARSADLPYDMNAALRAVFDALGGGRGGGPPHFVQGGGVSAGTDALEEALRAGERALRS